MAAALLAAVELLGVLFACLLFDPASHRAVNAANTELQGGQPFKLPWIPILDRTWGLFGSRTGGGYLAFIRSLLFAEFLVAIAASGSGPPSLPLLLAAAGFGITILLSLLQLKAHYPPAGTSPST